MPSAAKPARLSKADFAAMAAIAKARKQNRRTMFKGATIVCRTIALSATAVSCIPTIIAAVLRRR